MSPLAVGAYLRLVMAAATWAALVGSACVMHQGAPVSTTPADLLTRAQDMRIRGDMVARDNLLERAQHTHPGSVGAVVATMERASTPAELMRGAVLGALGASRLPASSVDGCSAEDAPAADHGAFP